MHDLRDWTDDRHHTVDDTPYGGGPGMVMMTEPWGDALDAVLADGYEAGAHGPVLVVPTPSGRPFTQERRRRAGRPARGWSSPPPATRASTRRVTAEYATRMPVHEVSIGDYVLAGGEAAVLVITEAVARLLPGVLGNAQSHARRLLRPRRHGRPARRARSTPSPRSGAAAASPTCCSAATTAGSPAGAATRRSAVPIAHRPDLSSAADPAAFDKKDREMLSILGWQPGPDGRFGRNPDAVEE